MKKIFCFLVLAVVSAVIISADFINNTPQALIRVVTHVDIVCEQEDVVLHRYYEDPVKVQSVLLYLRLLKPLQRPDVNPDEIDADIFEITLHFSDGEKRNYRQKAHRYLSKEYQAWQVIHPEQAAGLYKLMDHFPSDSPTL